jgi:hypothetical protein
VGKYHQGKQGNFNQDDEMGSWSSHFGFDNLKVSSE